MRKDYSNSLPKFFEKNPDVGNILEKIDSRKVGGDYYAQKAVRNGVPGYILKIKLFVPLTPVTHKFGKRIRLPKLMEVWVEGNTIRMLIAGPPDALDTSKLRYKRHRLYVKQSGRKWISFFVGLPTRWNEKHVSYSNGILQIEAPLERRRRTTIHA